MQRRANAGVRMEVDFTVVVEMKKIRRVKRVYQNAKKL